jgi:hypothetical protein
MVTTRAFLGFALMFFSWSYGLAVEKQSPCDVIENTCTNFNPGKTKKDSEPWKACIRSIMNSDENGSVSKSTAYPKVQPALVAECKQLKPNFGKSKKTEY